MPEIKYMECRGCGEVFEQTPGGFVEAAVAHQLDGECKGRGFRRNLSEDEAF